MMRQRQSRIRTFVFCALFFLLPLLLTSCIKKVEETPPAPKAEKKYGGQTLPQWKKRLKNFIAEDKSNHSAIPALLEIVQDKTLEWHTRKTAALTLARIGKPAREAIPVLIELTNPETETEQTQIWACKALAKFGPVASQTAPILKKRLRERQGSLLVRLIDIDILSRIGTAHPQVLPTLIDLLNDSDARQTDQVMLREASLLGMMSLGPAAAPATLALIEALSDSKNGIRNKATLVLAQIGPAAQSAITPLSELLLSEETNEIRNNAALALTRMGPTAYPIMKQLLADPEVTVRRSLTLAISQEIIKNKTLLAEFKEAFKLRLEDDDQAVQLAAAQGLIHLDPFQSSPKILEIFISILTSKDHSVRVEAMREIVKMPIKVSLKRDKIHRLNDHPRKEVRSTIKQLLKRLDK